MNETLSAALVIIGNEILSGRTQDVNAAFLARRLNTRGIALGEIRVVPDEEDKIISAVNALRAIYRYVFTTGGIGPTHDDITTATIAKAFGRPVERRPEAVLLLEQYLAGRADLNEARLRMADIPVGARLIENPVSGAPGFFIDNVYVLPGVPRIMQAMVDKLLPTLEGCGPILSTVVCASVREGEIADGLGALQDRYPGAAMGSYPFAENGQISTRVVLRGTDGALLREATDAVAEMMRLFDPDLVVTYDWDQMSGKGG